MACSTKKNTFLSRNSHALSTEYNILYNGQLALDKGLLGIKDKNIDNFWQRLPIEQMQFLEETKDTSSAKNPDFALAEKKATKAIQKHSMNIGGRERNMQIDEAYLLLGKARYFDARFIPAIDAFNYILYKYPNSSKIFDAKIWFHKANMRLENDALVVQNCREMLKKDAENRIENHEKKTKKQLLSKQNSADVHTILSEAFLNLEEKDSAVYHLNKAILYINDKVKKGRLAFILAQLYEETGKKQDAELQYDAVIAMNRKTDRKYIINAHVRKAHLFNYQNGDTLAFLKNFNKLIANRENRPFLGILNHQMGVYYDTQKNAKKALEFYNSSIKKTKENDYLLASNYRNIATIFFNKAQYANAAKYYDSTLVKMDIKTREFLKIEKFRKNLEDVIRYEEIANRNDSILNILKLSPNEQVTFFEKYIEKRKTEDEKKRLAEERRIEAQKNIEKNNSVQISDEPIGAKPIAAMPILPEEKQAVFYFYNPTTVSYGKLAFKRQWGNRAAKGYWRINAEKNVSETPEVVLGELTDATKTFENQAEIIEAYTVGFYTKQLPSNPLAIDSINKKRNQAYYQLGIIYKEKFKEYDLASNKLEQLLKQNPEEKWVLPTLYNLYKIYQITDASKANAIKQQINQQFPNTIYADIINHTSTTAFTNTPQKSYENLYLIYQNANYLEVVALANELAKQYTGDPILPKIELLKAYAIGKVEGVSAFKSALESLVINHENSEEAKEAKEILANQVPFLTNREFVETSNQGYKILYKIPVKDTQTVFVADSQIQAYLCDQNYSQLFTSVDDYDGKSKFLVLHDIKTYTQAEVIARVLKEEKKYQITPEPIIITTKNYSIIQIKKNLEEYLSPKKL